MVYSISDEGGFDKQPLNINEKKISAYNIKFASGSGVDQFYSKNKHSYAKHNISLIEKIWYKLTNPIKTVIKDVIALPGVMWSHALGKEAKSHNGDHNSTHISNDILPQNLIDIMDGQIPDIPENENPFLKDIPFITP